MRAYRTRLRHRASYRYERELLDVAIGTTAGLIIALAFFFATVAFWQ